MSGRAKKNDGAGAERGAGASRNGNGAVSGLNWPLKFRSKVICATCNALQSLFSPCQK